MHIHNPLPLLGGLSASQFMRQYWQKKPLLIRQAFVDWRVPVTRTALFALAAQEGVESRLIQKTDAGWQLRQGPLSRRALPPLTQAQWTLLVQGVDTHQDAVHDLMQQFRFVPDARLDDVMISYATTGGGVGPHTDSYDVFLLQAHGRRRWRIGKPKDLTLQDDVPLKILANFEYDQEWVLEPGDMLYLPPKYAHDGVAMDECMTYSIGFRAPARAELAQELLARLAEDALQNTSETVRASLYRDKDQSAVEQPGAIPSEMVNFAKESMERALAEPHAIARVLGEYLTEPKPHIWFDAEPANRMMEAVRLDRKTRMAYDDHHIFINGESYRAAGRDAVLMRRLCDDRYLSADAVAKASDGALELLSSWCDAGWLLAEAV